jgi:hypothetical protein
MAQELSDRWRHDMKNQLGIILGFSELLLQEMEEADVHRTDIAEIHRAAQRAMALLGHAESSDAEPAP